jgi:hypothetical protein
MRFIGNGLIHMRAFFFRCKRTLYGDTFLKFQGNIWSERLEKPENPPPRGAL